VFANGPKVFAQGGSINSFSDSLGGPQCRLGNSQFLYVQIARLLIDLGHA
jgi:hypothetical protein